MRVDVFGKAGAVEPGLRQAAAVNVWRPDECFRVFADLLRQIQRVGFITDTGNKSAAAFTADDAGDRPRIVCHTGLDILRVDVAGDGTVCNLIPFAVDRPRDFHEFSFGHQGERGRVCRRILADVDVSAGNDACVSQRRDIEAAGHK